MRKRIFDIIQIGKREDFPSRFFDFFIVFTIFANITAMFLQTFSNLQEYNSIFDIVEWITVIIFAVEYILRIWTADYLYPEKSRFKAIIRFLLSFDGIVDLLTILPFFFLSGFVAFRMLRAVRILHLFRINAYHDSFSVITKVILEKKNQIFSSLFIIVMLMLASSLGMYSAEHEAQPEVFENAFSGIWWSVSTVLTVGYGDIYPITILGKVMAIIIAFLGVGAVAIPTGIISAGFVEVYTKVSMDTGVVDNDMKGVITAVADENSIFVGMSISEVKNTHGVRVLVLVRNGQTIIPQKDMLIEAGDTLIFQSDNVLSKIV